MLEYFIDTPAAKQLSKDSFWQMLGTETSEEKTMEINENQQFKGTDFHDDFIRECSLSAFIPHAASDVPSNGNNKNKEKEKEKEKQQSSALEHNDLILAEAFDRNKYDHHCSQPVISNNDNVNGKIMERTVKQSKSADLSDEDIDVAMMELQKRVQNSKKP